jgi:urease accessory protein UreF
MNDKFDVLRGREAAAVLENEAFKAAMQGLKSAVIQNWRECPVRDKEGQLLLLQLAKLTDKFEAILTGMVQSGDFAQRRIDLDSERDETQVRRFFRKVSG